MAIGYAVGTMARSIDARLGVREWLRGEPRPPAGGFDLAGEKLLDWGWICANLPRGPERGLDVGCGETPIIPTMLALGYEVVGVDLADRLAHQVAGYTHLRGDFNELSLGSSFDVIVACSSIEHFGLSGRYGSGEDPFADLKASRKIWHHLVSGGFLFLTVPVGRDAIHKPWHRVYGRHRLPQLLEGFEVIHRRFFDKEPRGPWREVKMDVALEHPAELRSYALGQWILRKPTA
jgi:hypothetical protein